MSSRQALSTLTQLAVPLFIVAATICRFVGDLNGNPLKRLVKILDQPIGQRIIAGADLSSRAQSDISWGGGCRRDELVSIYSETSNAFFG
jgi:hypothetical protein